MLHGFISYFPQPDFQDFGQSPAFSYICTELPKLGLNSVTHLLHSHTLTVEGHGVLQHQLAVQCSSVYGFQIRLLCLCCSPKDIGAFCLPRRSLARTVSFCQPTYVSNFTEKCEVFPLSNYCPDIFNEIWEFISTCSFLPLLFLIFTVFFFT